MCGVLQGRRAVRDAGPMSESDVWQWNMTEKVGDGCPLTMGHKHPLCVVRLLMLMKVTRWPGVVTWSRFFTHQHLVVSSVWFVMNSNSFSLLTLVLLSPKMSASSIHKTNLSYYRPASRKVWQVLLVWYKAALR